MTAEPKEAAYSEREGSALPIPFLFSSCRNVQKGTYLLSKPWEDRTHFSVSLLPTEAACYARTAFPAVGNQYQ